MKKLFLLCVLCVFMLAACDTTPETEKATITEPEIDTAPADTAGVEVDNTRVEAQVDSL